METLKTQPLAETYNPSVEAQGVIGALAVYAAEEHATRVIQAGEFRDEAAAHIVKHQDSSLSQFGEKLNTSTNHFARAEKKTQKAEELEADAAVNEAEIAISIDHTRGILGSFNDSQSGALDSLLSEKNIQLSPFIRSQKPPDTSWAKWLSSSEEGATDRQLLNFLQWHEDHHTRHNTMEDKVDQVREADRFAQNKFSEAHKAGLVPGEVIGRINEHFNRGAPAKFIFEDVVRVAAYQSLGYASRPDKSIHITSLEQEGTLLHEFSHIEIGTLRDQRPSTRWIDEAATETLAITADKQTADIYTFQDKKSYPLERALLESVIDSSDGKITRDRVLSAYATYHGHHLVEDKKKTVISAIDRHITEAIRDHYPGAANLDSFSNQIDRVRAEDASSHTSEDESTWIIAAVIALQTKLPPEKRIPNYELVREEYNRVLRTRKDK